MWFRPQGCVGPEIKKIYISLYEILKCIDWRFYKGNISSTASESIFLKAAAEIGLLSY